MKCVDSREFIVEIIILRLKRSNSLATISYLVHIILSVLL